MKTRKRGVCRDKQRSKKQRKTWIKKKDYKKGDAGKRKGRLSQIGSLDRSVTKWWRGGLNYFEGVTPAGSINPTHGRPGRKECQARNGKVASQVIRKLY